MRQTPIEDNQAFLLELILRQTSATETLSEMCRLAGANLEERQIAFFLLCQDEWRLAATGDLTPASIAILAKLDPGEISVALLERSAGLVSFTRPAPFSASHLYSGTGEVLGMLVCLNLEFESEIHYADLCRLAALALEHTNMLQDLTWQVDHDTLTGLYTRTCFERLLAQRLQIAPSALLCINIDRFKLINGVLGHARGDGLLRQIASRFSSCLPPGTVVARIGGDDFGAISRPELATETANCLLASLKEPFVIDGHQIYITASVGIGQSTLASTPESLEREAYVALYHAKSTARGKSVRFDSTMSAASPERLEMERCLRSALEKNELRLQYQPQVHLPSGVICAAEALLRWHPAGLGQISPASFIPILEETGLIIEVGKWVMRTACVQALEWRRRTGVLLRIAVNVSAVQLLKPGFVDDVKDVLRETALPPECLELELTESLFVGDFNSARSVLAEIHRLGISVAVDDFGVGQSSLSYLHKLPFQRLKIDQSFVRSIAEDEKNRPLVENIIRLGASLGMKTIAEGIERTEQLDTLHGLGCEEGQGYFFSKPLDPDNFLSLWLGFTANRTAKMKR